jgi:hypothetical protein
VHAFQDGRHALTLAQAVAQRPAKQHCICGLAQLQLQVLDAS